MRPLTRSMTPAEVSRVLEISPEVVSALLESGHVLCHVRKGETLIPLSELESLFREALIRIYQAEVEAATEVAAANVEPAPARETIELESEEPIPVSPPSPPKLEEIPEPAEEILPDHRIASRYVPLRQISGIFGETKFSVLQLSATGLRIRHNDPLVPGEEAKLSFALLKPARSIVVRARVVWTSIATMGEERFSISGLRIIEHADRLEQAIDRLRATHELQPERRVRTRRTEDAVSILSGISDEDIALVTRAMQKFASDPIEANRWYSRARFSLADEHVRRSAPSRPRDRDEVLALWEYLERQVEIAKIAGIVQSARGGSRAAN